MAWSHSQWLWAFRQVQLKTNNHQKYGYYNMGLLQRVFGRKADNTTIMTSRELSQALGGGYNADFGVPVSENAAMRINAVYSCVRVIAESGGILPLQLFEKKGDTRVQITDGSLHDVLTHQPNEYQTAEEFWESCYAQMAARGVFYAYINRVRGELRELLPLPPGSVQTTLKDSYVVEHKVTLKGGQQVVLTDKEIFRVPLMTEDGVNPMSPIGFNRHTMGFAMATQKHGANLFKNGGKVPGALRTEQNLTKEQYEQLRDSWYAAYGGENSGSPAVLTNGLQWQNISVTAQEMQYIENRKLTRSEIAGIFRVPPHKIGDLERATFSNIEHQDIEFVNSAIIPYARKIEGRIRTQLVPKDKQKLVRAKFRTNAFLRGDMKSRSEFYTGMVQNGAMSPNEIRALEDMNPREGGNIYLTPLNMAVNAKPNADTTESNSEAGEKAASIILKEND
jgi:HK97 family phage portal protein